MCGVALAAGRDREAETRRMVGMLELRGPDGTHVVDFPHHGLCLGHTRLSIIDLSDAGRQPMESSCGRYVLTFNGEIYNYIELKERLEESRRRRLRSASDTEVFLELMAQGGREELCHVDGMYAFALYDRQEATVLLARDSFGEKPLYYSVRRADGDWRVAAASEPRCLLSLDWVDRSIDEKAVYDYLTFLYTAAPVTFWSGVTELKPGNTVEVDLREQRVGPTVRVSTPRDIVLDSIRSRDTRGDHDRTAAELVRRSVEVRLRSDVPLGVYLSAGLDSNVICSVSTDHRRSTGGESVQTFTMDYAGLGASERSVASAAASYHGAENEQVLLAPGSGLPEMASRALELFSGPFGNFTALAADSMAEVVSRTLRVALVGDGGDELFGGYPRYRALRYRGAFAATKAVSVPVTKGALVALRRRPHSAWYRRGRQFVRAASLDPSDAFLDWSTYLTREDLRGLAGASATSPFREDMVSVFDEVHHASGDATLAAAAVDLESFVPYNLMQSADRTSMAHSLELRSPFLQADLLRMMSRVPTQRRVPLTGGSKPLLRHNRHFDLYPPVRREPKRAFNPPLATILRSNRPWVEDTLLTSGGGVLSQVCDSRGVDPFVRAFFSDGYDNSTLLWGLLLLAQWNG